MSIRWGALAAAAAVAVALLLLAGGGTPLAAGAESTDKVSSAPPGTPSYVHVARADGWVKASWRAVPGATSYHVTYSTTGGASWVLAAYSYTNTSISIRASNKHSYIVAVRARNANGWGGWRNSPTAAPYKPPTDEPGVGPPEPTPTPPDKPGIDPPGNPSRVTVTRSDGALTASWPAVKRANTYHVTYSTNGGGFWRLAAHKHPSTSITIDAANDKTYIVGVRALGDGGWGGWRNSPASGPYTPPTPQPPGQPTGLTATAGEDGTATISWDDPNDASITGYQYQTREDDGVWGGSTEIEGSGASTTSTEISGLTAGATNHINLQALNAVGASTGRQVSVKVPARLAGPDSVTITTRGTGTLSALWTAVDTAFTYYVQTSNSSDDYATFEIETSTTGTSVTLNNRDDSLNYTVLVHAFTEHGYTKRTESYPAGTSTSPAIAPESVSLSRSGTTLTATWPAVIGAANYNVEYRADNGNWTSGATAHTTTTWTLSNITTSASYTVRVQSKNSAGTSAWTESDVNTSAPPAPASVTPGTRSGTTLNVSWSAAPRATSYNVQSSSDNGTNWSASKSQTGTTTALAIDATKDYFVRVQAVNSSGNSGWTVSPISRATPLPPAPANLTTTRAKGSVTLTWDAATGAASYDVTCSVSGGYYWDDCKKGVTDAQRSAGVAITQFYNHGASQTQNIDDGRNYTFAVRGRNTSGAGEWTRVTAWATRPDRIASVTATSRDADGITLSMTVPADKGGYTVTRIEVDCRTSSDGGTTWSGWFKCTDAETQANPAGGSTLTTDIDSTDNYSATLAYQARARAHNALGYTWVWRESATIHSIPAAPTITNYASTILAWTEPSDTGSGPTPKFNVYCRADADDAWTKKVDAATITVGQTSHITSLVLYSECTASSSQVELSIVNVYESERVRWSPLTFTAGSITATTATLTLSNHGLTNWYAKKAAPTTGTCSSAITTDTHSLTLTAGTLYTYKAYSDSTCTDANEIGAVVFATPLTVSNLSETGTTSNFQVGQAVNQHRRIAQGFTTGSHASGYTLSSITIEIQGAVGSPGSFEAKLYSASGSSVGSEVATLSGSDPSTSGNHTYTCSGSGCARLLKDTTYYIVLNAPNAPSGYNYYPAVITTATSETKNPSTNGWSLADTALQGNVGSSGWTSLGSYALRLRVTAEPKSS